MERSNFDKLAELSLTMARSVGDLHVERAEMLGLLKAASFELVHDRNKLCFIEPHCVKCRVDKLLREIEGGEL